jgi:cytosine/adenosine deaminase-related metal-dependent hydrolase
MTPHALRPSPLLLRARVVLPVTRPPLRDGALLIRGNRIAAVGGFKELRRHARAQVLDLGDAVLLPGLINAHCHLDYTHMAGQFLPPKKFTEWLKLITSTKATWDYADYFASWQSGAQMLLRSGTTTVGDTEAVPELLPGAWETTPLRVFSFLELIGITPRRQPRALLEEVLQRLGSLKSSRCWAGISPHAPYSTTAELMRLSAQTARRHRRRLCTHVAESAVEFEMFAEAQGEMFDWLGRSARDMSDCGLGSPVQHLARCGALGKNLLAIHANYLAQGDAKLLARAQASVAHCPRSHAYFDHGPFPLRQLQRAGVNVCLGTDSLASVYQPRRQKVELSMFEEMRALAMAQPSLPPRQILRMATVNGAQALGLQGRVGELAIGSRADIIAIPLLEKSEAVFETMLQHKTDVIASMIDGQWVAPQPPNHGFCG